MATVLKLNGKQVYPDGKQTIKVTKENPYFTQSESYTLEVTLPMDILDNRNFFGSIHRIERGKTVPAISCQLSVDNRSILSGMARVTQINEKEVKVQLIGGMSEIKFSGNERKVYIDEMRMGGPTYTIVPSSTGRGSEWIINDVPVRYVNMPVYDETNDLTYGEKTIVPQPRLNDILKEVLAELGYTLEENPLDTTPWDCLYVANAMLTQYLSHTLPHWTVDEFITEYCKFFNCTLVTNQHSRTVRVVPNKNYFGTARHTEISPIDVYTVEMSEENYNQSLCNDNLRFDLSASEEHDYDIISDELRDAAPTEVYASLAEAIAAYNEKGETEKLSCIYKTPVGRYAGWKHDYSDVHGGEHISLTQIDVFAPLIRDIDNDNEVSLKIVPVAISEVHTIGDRYEAWTYRMPSLECHRRWDNLEGLIGRNADESEVTTIQEYIEGEAVIKESEKEDRMQVFFVDDIEQQSINTEYSGSGGITRNIIMPFTDFRYKRNHIGNTHRQWSLSLNPTDAEHYLGQLHDTNFSINLKAKYRVQFLADEMPDPTQVFIIRNKRYACEKIEASIDERGMQQLMTGYFYEMTEQRSRL